MFSNYGAPRVKPVQPLPDEEYQLTFLLDSPVGDPKGGPGEVVEHVLRLPETQDHPEGI
jgi:hypothetical protein